MIVYEVNLLVQRAIEPEFRAWLDAHVREIVALPGFVSATVLECIDPVADTQAFGLCTHYRLRDETALADYLREQAPRLRADGVARFGNAFSAERRLLRTLSDY